MTKWHGGKGSNRRKEDTKKFNENWDKIFNNKKRGTTHYCPVDKTDIWVQEGQECNWCGGLSNGEAT